MANAHEDEPPPSVRFKRRKTTHAKRILTRDDGPTESTSQLPNGATAHDAPSLSADTATAEEPALNLKEILRNRTKLRDRYKAPARKVDTASTQLVAADPPRPDQYTSRFVAQTGQVVDRDDKQMTEYVEARTAERNYRQYGWPVPIHLQAMVAALAPDLKHTFTPPSSSKQLSSEAETPVTTAQSERLAAGQGKLQEVDLGPDAAARADKAWQKLQSPEDQVPGKPPKEKHGNARRRPKRRNSEDIRRDAMVEAVLREAKLEYFDDSAPANPFSGNTNNDDAVAERFQAEYFESMEEARMQRKPVLPSGGAKGVKEAPKGPKLGGSKSARAKILKAQEDEKKGSGKR